MSLVAAWPWAEAAAAMRFEQVVERWHEFYLLAGTAAVTLVGLLFVALSFHLETLLHDSRAHLLALARHTFSGFVYVLLFSLMFLIPGTSERELAVWSGAISLAFLVVMFTRDRARGGSADPSGHDRFLGRRRRQQVLVLLIGLATSIALAVRHDPEILMMFAAVMTLQLAGAAWTSWDLLVQVGRIKQSAARPDA